MRTVAIIQARMGSTRLPGKVMMDLGGRTILAWVVARAGRARTLDDVVVATTTLERDDVIVAECSSVGVSVFRGSEDDVLDRYFRACEHFDADVVVRLTADCPLIDPEVIDNVVTDYRVHQPDYASNTLERRLPRGLDVEVFSRAALAEAWSHDDSSQGREHVTPYLYVNPGKITLDSVALEDDHSILRWTVDTAEDLEVVRGIVTALGNRDDFGWREALAVVEQNPILATTNQHVRQRTIEDG
jgi:spore coat polysaccharide biosynthesis protein SpsF